MGKPKLRRKTELRCSPAPMPKPIIMWAVISNHLNAVPIVQCVAYERKWAIASALSDWETWPGLRSQGYRCVKVRVEVIE